MDMKLYEIKEIYLNVLSMIEEAEEQDKQEDLKKHLDQIDDALEEKADNIARIISELNAEVLAIKEEEQRLNARRKTRENNIAWLKQYLQYCMISTNKKKFATPYFSFNVQKNAPSLNILSEDNISDEFYKVEKKLQKKDLLNAIKQGLEVDGVEIKQTESLRIR